MFINTEMGLLFLLFVLFGLNMITLSMLIATLFDQPKLAAGIAWLTFLVSFMIYRFVEESTNENAKQNVCLSGPACFSLGIIQIAEYEEYEIGIVSSNINELNELTFFRFSTCYLFLFIDSLIYLS